MNTHDLPMLCVNDETSRLKTVVVGRGDRCGPRSPQASNEQSYLSRQANLYPRDADLAREVDAFSRQLEDLGVCVIRPDSAPGLLQIFSRDIGFVIGDQLVHSPMSYSDREREWNHVSSKLPPAIEVDDPRARIEGGDVLVCGDTVFVGTGHRTNKAGLAWLRNFFTERSFVEIELVAWTAENKNPDGVLHLDCMFHPISSDLAILFEHGARDTSSLRDSFGSIIEIDQDEKRALASNVFSVAPGHVVTDGSARRVNQALRKQGVETIEIDYEHVRRLGGAFRCSTLPLQREST